MSWVWTNSSVDGTHIHTFKTEKAAVAAFCKWLGRATDYGDPITANKSVVDDYGGRHYIEERAGKTNARQEDALRRAYDARECGVATKRQLALLDKRGF